MVLWTLKEIYKGLVMNIRNKEGYVMAKLMQKNHKSQNFFKNNILSDSLLTKYTLKIRLKSLQ